ncbi:MAG: secretin N-terminal domain-containing protein [Luteolibacter sp.]
MSVPRSITLLLLGIVSVASAQQPAAAPPGVPVPPVPAAGAPAAQPPGVPIANPPPTLGETKITEPIEEPKLTGDALAGLYRKYTGRRVIPTSAASIAEFRFVQDASPKDPLTYAQAAELLRVAATLEGFVFVPHGSDPNLDILTANGGVRPTGVGVAIYNENDTLPEGDAVVSYVMNLSYIKPAEAVNTFTQIIGQFGAYGSIAPVANASAIVITENTTLIRKLIDLKKEIDKPSSQVGTRFIKVQYADVTEIATTLTDLLTAQQSAQTTAGIQRSDNGAAPAAGAPPGAPAAAGSSGSSETTPVQIIPDPRTNRIFAMGRPVDLLFVEGLVREFDVETSEKNFLRRKLKFLTVSEFLPVAGDALTRAFSGTGPGGSQGGASGGGASQQGNRGAGGGGQGNNNRQANNTGGGRTSGGSNGSSSGGAGNGFGGGGGSGGSGGGVSAGNALSDPSVSSAPESVLVGRTLLVADNITNSIVVQGPPSGLEIIERLLDQIDVKPEQVMISTVIGQLTLNNNTETGASYLFNGENVLGGGGGGFPGFSPAKGATATANNRIPGFDKTTLVGAGLRAYGKVGDLGIAVKALQSKTDFTVLSRPSIFTSNNQKGTISSGEKIAIPTGSNSYGSTGNASTQIEYQDVVLKLEVIPLVNSENEITMQIALLNDEQNGTQVIDGGAGNGQPLTVPKISTREILTTVTVPNEQTIVLGGLITKKNDKTRSGIPILCDIPLLGRLFSTTIDNKDRSELMVFIQPSVVKNDRSLNAVQADMDARYDVSGRTRTFADGPGVLPPIDSIPTTDKGGSTVIRRSAPLPPLEDPVPPNMMKPSIRPFHRQ